MREIVLIFLLLVVNSCHSQEKENKDRQAKGKLQSMKIEIPINPKTMQTRTTEEFTEQEVQKYKKNRTDGGYQYVNSDGATVLETDDDLILFRRDITSKHSFFTINKEYHPNRKLWMKYSQYIRGGFRKGISYEYNEQGKLVKAEDHDKPFKFTWEQVKKYIEQDLKLDLLKDEVNVNNYDGITGGKPTWEINYKGKYKDVFGVYYITLDGINGELLKVIKILGRDGEQQIIFEKK